MDGVLQRGTQGCIELQFVALRFMGRYRDLSGS